MKQKNCEKNEKQLIFRLLPPRLKRVALVCLIIFGFVTVSKGQLNKLCNEMTVTTTLQDITSQMEPFLDSLKNTMDSVYYYGGAGEFKNYKKFLKTWEPRIGQNGTFSTYYQQQENYWKNNRNSYEYISEKEWHELGPIGENEPEQSGIGPVEFLSIYDDGSQESTKYMLTGSLLSGIFYSTNSGEQWNKTGTDTEWPQSGCSSAVFKPGDHCTWFASSSGNSATGRSGSIGYTGGVWRTTDEGKTWELIGDKDDFGNDNIWCSISKVICDPDLDNPNTLYIVTNSGIFKTDSSHIKNPDWTNILPQYAHDFEFKPGNSSVCYASVYDRENDLNRWRLKISNDSGATWNDLPTQPDELVSDDLGINWITIEVSKAKPTYLYCAAENYDNVSVYYNNLAENSGWINISNLPDGFRYGDGHGFGVDQAGQGTRIIISRNLSLRNIDMNNQNNTKSLPVTHIDVEDVVFDPHIPDKVWICTHGGVEMTSQNIEDNLYCFRPKYNGLGIAEVERMATSTSNAERVVTGLYHDNTQYTKTPYVKPWNPDWKKANSGDGMQALINNSLPDHVLFSGQTEGWKYTSDYFVDPLNMRPIDDGGSAHWSMIGVLKYNYPYDIFYRNKKFEGIDYEEVFRSVNYETVTPTNDYISNFREEFNIFPNGDPTYRIYVTGIYTSSSSDNKNCLVATVAQSKLIDDVEFFTWHLMRTMDATVIPASLVVWDELSIPREDAWINDIEFQPGSTDIMYISYAPVIGPDAEQMIYKLDYTDINNPPVVDDITKDLPLVPFGQMTFDNTQYKGLYLSTDAGVFYTNSEMLQYETNQWKLVGKNLPHTRGNGLDVVTNSNTIRIGTWGRGVWELPIPCFTSQIPYEITANTSWPSPTAIYDFDRNLVIKSGFTLTLNPGVVLKFSQDASVIIEPGAKLVVNGATLTNLCDGYYWNGIQVWGNTEASQYTIEGLCAQGKLILDEATIQNAWNAVTLWKPDDWHSTGGIIVAKKANFLNNKRSVEFMSYHNFNPANADRAPNLSSFSNCQFSFEDAYMIGSPFDAHVTMWDVEGITFKGCVFANNKEDSQQTGTGILAMDSKFAVMPYCNSISLPCPEENIINCSFTGLYAGIDASTADINKPFSVSDAVFNVNTFGVKASDVDFASVISSTFIIGPNERDKGVCADAAGYGIYMDNSTGFAIEENEFNITNPFVLGIYFGISINNTNGVDEIYSNTFTGLNTGNYASGKNWTNNDWTGLTYFCDKNTANWADFYVVGINYEDVIQTSQGTKTDVTGNTFSGSEHHFYNGTKNLISYFYCATCSNETPDDLKIENVIKEPIALSNTCPSHYGSGGSIVLNSQQKLEREQEYATALINFNSVKTLYDNLKDGGSTASTLADIQTAQPQDMWNLRAALLGDSPHLSEEVLKQVADKTDVFTESVIFDILAANPDELKREELLKYLEDKANPLPAYMIDILRQLATGTTYKTVLQLELSKHNRAKTRAAHDMIRSYLNDTVPDMVQLRNWLDNLGGIEADKQIIGTYVQEANFTDALALATLLPQLYALQNADLEEHNRFMAMLTLQQTLNAEDRKINVLTETELSWLNEVALISKGGTGAQAKNILEFFYGAHFFNCQVLNDSASNKSYPVNPNELGEAYGLNITVKPNPAKDWAAFDYTLPNNESTAILLITDINGKHIESLGLNGNQGQKLWDTRYLPAGAYIYTLKSAGFSKTGKIVITK